jgi:hypothetical protein
MRDEGREGKGTGTPAALCTDTVPFTQRTALFRPCGSKAKGSRTGLDHWLLPNKTDGTDLPPRGKACLCPWHRSSGPQAGRNCHWTMEGSHDNCPPFGPGAHVLPWLSHSPCFWTWGRFLTPEMQRNGGDTVFWVPVWWGGSHNPSSWSTKPG